MENVSIREYQPGDEAGILALYQAVFEVTLSHATWEWFYQKNPEAEAIIVVAEADEGIVGHYAIQPRPFWFGGTSCLAGLTVGTMVHPSARNLKTLVEMAHLAYDLCRQRGLLFLYSFSRNDAWKIRQVVLGWQALSQITTWEGPLHHSKNALSNPFQSTQLYEELPIETFDKNSFPIQGDSYQGIGCRSTLSWLNWRFFQNPTTNYKLLIAGSLDNLQGYAVLKIFEQGGMRYGHIVDWQVPNTDKAIAHSLFKSAQQVFSHLNIERLSCWALPSSSLLQLLQEADITESGRTTNFGYLNLALDSDEMLKNESNWTIYMGDSDVY